MDAYWRRMDELFSGDDLKRLHAQAEVVWGKDAPIPEDVLEGAWPRADVLVAECPRVSKATLDLAPKLRMIIEVSGAFPDTIDYAACADRGVEVLSCSPGFRQSVAEMGLGMAIAGARGIVAEHMAFGQGQEHWLSDNDATDFTLFRAPIGFIGFGQIAQELSRLLVPFNASISAFDPWLGQEKADQFGVTLADMEEVLARSRILFVIAVPTRENKGLIGAPQIARMPQGAHLVLLSRAHLVQMDAVLTAVKSGRIRAALDVFDLEPVPADHPMRQMDGLILSPHRAAAVPGGRQLIGAMLLDDIAALLSGAPARSLLKANAAQIEALAGVGDAAQVGDMAKARS